MAKNVKELQTLIQETLEPPKDSELKGLSEQTGKILSSISSSYKENAYAQILKKAIQRIKESDLPLSEKANLLFQGLAQPSLVWQGQPLIENFVKATQMEDQKIRQDTVSSILEQLQKTMPPELFQCLSLQEIVTEVTLRPYDKEQKNKLLRTLNQEIQKYFHGIHFNEQINHAFLIIALADLNNLNMLLQENIKKVGGFVNIFNAVIKEFFKLDEKQHHAFLNIFPKFRHYFGLLSFFAAYQKTPSTDPKFDKMIELFKVHFFTILEHGLEAHDKRRAEDLAKQLNLTERKELLDFFKQWCSEGGSKSKSFHLYSDEPDRGFQIVETAALWPMVIRGTDAGSCHSMENGNPGLVDDILLGGSRIISVFNQKGRAILRGIILLIENKKTHTFALYLTQIEGNRKYLPGLLRFAKERAGAYKLPLLSYGGEYTEFPTAILSDALPAELPPLEPALSLPENYFSGEVCELYSPEKTKDEHEQKAKAEAEVEVDNTPKGTTKPILHAFPNSTTPSIKQASSNEDLRKTTGLFH